MQAEEWRQQLKDIILSKLRLKVQEFLVVQGLAAIEAIDSLCSNNRSK
jgi:hypothetical protein